MKKFVCALFAVTVGLTASTNSFALEDLNPWYIAIEGSKLDFDVYANDNDDTPDRADSDLNAYRIRVGWNWTDSAAFEFVYGTSEKGELDNSGVDVQVRRYTNINLRYGGFAWDNIKLGGILGYSIKPKVDTRAVDGESGTEELDSDLSFGVFADYYITQSFALHFDWTHFFENDGEDDDIEYRLQGISFGASLSFGGGEEDE